MKKNKVFLKIQREEEAGVLSSFSAALKMDDEDFDSRKEKVGHVRMRPAKKQMIKRMKRSFMPRGLSKE